MDLTPTEAAIIIRGHLASKGWALQDEALERRLKLVEAQAFLLPEERNPDYKNWSIDRISGMVLGIGYARKFLPLWLDQINAAEAQAREMAVLEEGQGHPYGPPEGLTPA